MDKIAYISGGTVVYWNSIVLTLAAATAICFFLAFYIGKGGNVAAGFAAVPIALVLSLVAARFFHWYCRFDSYDSFLDAMTNYSTGGYALMGVFLGCFLAAGLLRLIRLSRSLPEMLDCMAISGCAGIAVGRLASLFNSSDRGQVLENFKSLPFAWPVTNAVSGAVEYRLATFMLQSLVALGLFFRSNGFVSVVQVLGALGLGLAIFVFSKRMVRNDGLKFWQFLLWLPIAAGIGCGGFMEYYVQRRGNEAAFAYSVMSGCLLGVILLTLLIRFLGEKHQKKMVFSE